MKRNLLVLILLGIMLLLLTGCGKKPASASVLENDLYNSGGFSRFSNELGMNITDFEIEKRQTTTESKVDIVWVSVKASGDTAKGEMYYKMTYNLYNDGWLLETIEDDNVDSWHFEPLCGVPDAEIADYMPEEAEILENTVDLDTATQTVTYTYEEPHLYCDVTYKKQLVFDFGDVYYSFGMCEPGTWGFRDEVDAGSYETWNISGTWYAEFERAHNKYGKYEVYFRIDEFMPTGIISERLQDGAYKETFALRGFYEQYRIPESNKYYYNTVKGPFEVGIVSNETNPHYGSYFIEMNEYDTSAILLGELRDIHIFLDYDNLWFDMWRDGHYHTEFIRDT